VPESEMMQDVGLKDIMKDETMGDTGESEVSRADRYFSKGDYKKAYDIYQWCASEGDRHSKIRMGQMLASGLGVERLPLRAFSLISNNIDDSDVESIFLLGKCHFEGIGTSVDKGKGFDLILRAAEREHPSAQNYVAVLYLEGDYVEKNPRVALRWLNKAVVNGDAKALYNVSELIDEGVHLAKDFDKSLDCLKRSADLNCPEANMKLGLMYLDGKGIEQDVGVGIGYLERATALGDKDAPEELGDYYGDRREDGDIDRAVDYYEKAVRNGNKNVLYDLGMIHNVVEEKRDYAKACHYFEEGHNRGDIRCSFEYAMMKSLGRGTEKDEVLAFQILLSGAEKGDVNFMRWLGHFYYEGIGTIPDKRKARQWFERGSRLKDGYCTMRLADMHLFGTATPVNEDFALDLYRRSFKEGCTRAAYELGMAYENDERIKSIPDSLYWYMAGAEAGEPECMIKLAGHYESGAFIERSEEKAFNLYNDAYDRGHSKVAAAEIGRCYEEGIGTETDIEKATDWYLKAVGENAFAMWRLYNIYSDTGNEIDKDRAVFWLRRSACKGSVSAMLELAKLYEEGTLIPKSDLRAMQWYHSAADEGNEYGKTRFKDMIRFDPEDSEDLEGYQRLAYEVGEKKDDNKIIEFANSLADGIDTSADLPRAKMWFEIANELHIKGARQGLKKVDSLLREIKETNYKQTTLD